jgi:hypothetical protein
MIVFISERNDQNDADNRRETRKEALLVERPVHRGPYKG